MAASQEVIETDDIVRLDLETLKSTTRDFDVDTDELSFPSRAHHMTVLAKLRALADRGVIEYDDVDDVYERWQSE